MIWNATYAVLTNRYLTLILLFNEKLKSLTNKARSVTSGKAVFSDAVRSVSGTDLSHPIEN